MSWALSDNPGERRSGKAAIRAEAKVLAKFVIGVHPKGRRIRFWSSWARARRPSVPHRCWPQSVCPAHAPQPPQVRWLMSKRAATHAGRTRPRVGGLVVVTRALRSLLFGVGTAEPAHDGLGIGHPCRGRDLRSLRSRRPRHTRRPGDGLARGVTRTLACRSETL